MPSTRRRRRRYVPIRSRKLQVAKVAIPSEIPGSAAIFLALRRMRQPLLILILVMAVAVGGLTMMPGLPQPDGSSGQLSIFEAFYVFSFTATTIGLGELPHEFSIYQRWWTILFIYVSVLGWANIIGRLMSLFQDSAFKAATAAQSVRRTINGMRQPFTIIVGYGYIGRTVARVLDRLGQRIVILDDDENSIDRLGTDLLSAEVPGVCGDARNPSILGLAGFGHEDCQAILAMTGDEEVNLQVVMTCALLRPELPVIARASTRRIAQAMADFSPQAIINPFDDFGEYLVLSLKQPHTYRLITWLMAEHGTELPELHPVLEPQNWLVLADGPFAEEILQDLTEEGYKVRIADPSVEPDLTGIEAVIAGAESDTVNLSLAAHLRNTHPDIFLVVRQHAHARLPLLDAFCPDSIFFPPQLVSQRAVANLITPRLWGFIKELMKADDAYCEELTRKLVERVGTKAPVPGKILISEAQTPTVTRWLKHRRLTLGALFRSPLDSSQYIAAMPLLIMRGDEVITLPDDDCEIEEGDLIVVVGTNTAFDEQSECLYDDSTLFYMVTGRDIPTSQAWRALTGQRWKTLYPETSETKKR